MSEAWSIIAVAGIAAIAILYLRSRKAGTGPKARVRNAGTGADRDRDYTQERNDDRHARMSDEDRTWEAASLQRNRDRSGRDDAPAEQIAPLG